MAFNVCVLASGSSGNCIYVSSEQTTLLIDAGLSAREIVKRMEAIGVPPSAVQGICLTHEHSDHTAGLRVLHKRFGMKIYANSGTVEGFQQIENNAESEPAWTVFSTGSPFQIGDLRIESFSVPHDALDPVGYVISDGSERVGIVTDMGVATELIRQRLRACNVLVLESNHDEQMLRNSSRPWSLKQRILGRHGHLSNRDAAALLCDVAGPDLRMVFLAHLSMECNRPELAASEVERALRENNHQHVRVAITYADRVSEVWRSAS